MKPAKRLQIMFRAKVSRALLCLLVASFAMAIQARAHEPIFGLGPHTIYQYGYALGMEFEKSDFGWANNLELIYGVTPDWSLTVAAPYLLSNTGGSTGFGDFIVRSKYRFYRKDVRGASRQAALHAGVKFPAGDVKKGLGSGSTDFFAGVSLGYESRRHYFFSGARYYVNGTYQGFHPGNVLQFNLAYGIRPWLLEYKHPDAVFIIELHGSRAGRARANETAISESGGSVLRVGPGLLFSYRNVMLKAGVSIPVAEKFHSAAAKAATEYVLAIEMHMPPLK